MMVALAVLVGLAVTGLVWGVLTLAGRRYAAEE
jgi:hypothetical protein